MATDPNTREQIEPGVMGETDPAEQRLLENMSHIAAGYALAKGGGTLGESLYNKISSKLSSAGSTIGDVHKLAGLTSEESAAVKKLLPSQEPTEAGTRIREMWGDMAKEQSGTSPKVIAEYKNPEVFRETPKIEVFSKGVQKGAGTIWGVRGDPKVLLKEFGDPAPGSVPESILRAKGIPLPAQASLVGFGLRQASPDSYSQLQSIKDKLQNESK